jgi:hypothetical protein
MADLHAINLYVKKPTMPQHPHSILIRELGGPPKIRDFIKAQTGEVLSTQRISMWGKQGVAQKFRPLLVTMARSLRKSKFIPANFVLGAAA